MLKFVFTLMALSAALFAADAQTAPADMRVASYNLRYDNRQDSIEGNGWKRRAPQIATVIKRHGFEIFGTQEGLAHQLADLDSLLPGFAHIGVGRTDGKAAGEHAAIFYNTDRFKLLDHGDFWLSETPDKPGKGWDAALPRICTWGHFLDNKTGKQFLFFNLHMDHIGRQARVESCRLIVKKMKEFGPELPAILTGDFNVDQTEEPYAEVVRSGMSDAYEAAAIRYAPNGTWHDYHPERWTTERIDHIFLTPGIQTDRYEVLTDTYWTPGEKVTVRTPSDHYPVAADIRLP